MLSMFKSAVVFPRSANRIISTRKLTNPTTIFPRIDSTRKFSTAGDGSSTPPASPPFQVTNLLGEHLSAISLNPFRAYLNAWRLGRFRSKYDPMFRLDEFQIGARQALVVVTRKLYEMDFDGLHGLMSEEILNRLRPAIEKLSDEDRGMLNIHDSDIYGQFLFSTGYQQSTSGHDFFEILLAHHTFLGMEAFQKENPQASIKTLMGYSDRFVLANVKFAKRLTPSVDADWTITYANFGRTKASSK